MKCIKCGREHNDYHFRVLQVQTLHVRDFGKNSRIQALGDFEEYDVCAQCAQEKHRANTDTTSAVRKMLLIFGLLTIAGAILAVAFWNGEGVFRLLGLGMAVSGILCLIGNLRSIHAKKAELANLPMDKALYCCAWECMTDRAPKKHDVNDITYIPVDEETLARKNGDLMILYDLVPEIAIEAHKRIHDIPEE